MLFLSLASIPITILLFNKFLGGTKDMEKPNTELNLLKKLPLPFEDPFAWEMLSRMQTVIWSHSELDYSSDIKDYDELSTEERHIIDTILGFFLPADGAINDNLAYRFLIDYGKNRDIGMVFTAQMYIENEHALTYNIAALAFKKTEEAVQKLVLEAEQNDYTKKKMSFIDRWQNSEAPLYQRLTAFACAERIFFCTLFGAIYWFRSRGKLPSFNTANDFIKRDESMHGEWGAYLVTKEFSSLPDEKQHEARLKILEIVKEATEIEYDFCDVLLPQDINGEINSNGLKEYARLMADKLLNLMNMPSYYKATCPYSWLASIDNEVKVNTFELRSASYSTTSVDNYMNWQKRAGLVTETINVLQNPEAVDF